MISNGAFRIPAIAETVPDSERSRRILAAERVEVIEHGHPALQEREVVTVGVGTATGDDVGGDAGQPDVEKEAGRVVDQVVVLVGPHEGFILRGLAVLEPCVGRNVNAGDGVVLESDRLGQAGPDINHVRHNRIPVEFGGALAGGNEGLFVVVGHLLAREPRIFGCEFRDEGSDGDAIRFLISHGGHVTVQPLFVQPLHGGAHLFVSFTRLPRIFHSGRAGSTQFSQAKRFAPGCLWTSE